MDKLEEIKQKYSDDRDIDRADFYALIEEVENWKAADKASWERGDTLEKENERLRQEVEFDKRLLQSKEMIIEELQQALKETE